MAYNMVKITSTPRADSAIGTVRNMESPASGAQLVRGSRIDSGSPAGRIAAEDARPPVPLAGLPRPARLRLDPQTHRPTDPQTHRPTDPQAEPSL